MICLSKYLLLLKTSIPRWIQEQVIRTDTGTGTGTGTSTGMVIIVEVTNVNPNYVCFGNIFLWPP